MGLVLITPSISVIFVGFFCIQPVLTCGFWFATWLQIVRDAGSVVPPKLAELAAKSRGGQGGWNGTFFSSHSVSPLDGRAPSHFVQSIHSFLMRVS
jgi:hypothetical protein